MASTSSSGNGTNGTSVLEFRRRGDPLSCQRIWDAIKACRKDKHPTTLENIQKKCVLLYPSMDDKMMIAEQLKYLVIDKLVLRNTVMSSKGSNKGTEYFVYSIPLDGDVEYDRTHDWYCFLCHKAGEVLTCVSCPKVYHVTCLEKKNIAVDLDHLTCPACIDMKQQFILATDKKTYNHLLWFASCRLDSLQHKLPERIDIWNPSADTPIYSAALTTDRRANMIKKSYLKAPSTPPPMQEGVDELWRSRFLIHTSMNHDSMMSKADRQVYKSLAQFHMDSETIVHNVSIFHGENSPLADRARMVHRDCVYELNEIKICRDCYRRSNEQQEEDWFCQPCDPPHELVFAKAKGYPYWPAKVLRTQETVYDVRFFGANHDRASLRIEHIAPITSCTNTLVPIGKRNAKWIKAVDELMKHQEILKNVGSPKTDSTEPSDTSDVEMADDPSPPSPEEEEVEEEERPRKMLRLSINVNRLPSYLWSRSTSGECASTSATIPDVKVPSSAHCAPSTSGADEMKKLKEKLDFLNKDIANLKEKHNSELKAAEERYKEALSQSAKAQREKESVSSQLEQSQRDKKFFSSQLEQTRREKESLVLSHSNEMNQLKEQLELAHQENARLKHGNKESMVLLHSNEMNQLKEQLELAQQENARLKHGNNHELRNEQARTQEGADAMERARDAVQAEIEALKRAHAYEVHDMIEKHASVVAIIKTKSWCKACDAEGLLHCCLNVWYCSTECQRKNWKDHKGTCKRDRTAGRNQANQSRDSSLLSSTKK